MKFSHQAGELKRWIGRRGDAREEFDTSFSATQRENRR